MKEDKKRNIKFIIIIALCFLALILITLTKYKIIPSNIGSVFSYIIIGFVCVWSGITYLKNKRNGRAVLMFFLALMMASSILYEIIT